MTLVSPDNVGMFAIPMYNVDIPPTPWSADCAVRAAPAAEIKLASVVTRAVPFRKFVTYPSVSYLSDVPTALVAVRVPTLRYIVHTTLDVVVVLVEAQENSNPISVAPLMSTLVKLVINVLPAMFLGHAGKFKIRLVEPSELMTVVGVSRLPD